jgi:hypothetical protein
MYDCSPEGQAFIELTRVSAPPVLEGYRGTDVVGWYGQIERQLVNMVQRFQTSRNYEAKAQAQVALDTWRENELTGSINTDTVKTLIAMAETLSVVNWNESNYFAGLRDSLRRLRASQEELPPMGDFGEPSKRTRRPATPTGELAQDRGLLAAHAEEEEAEQPEGEPGEPTQDFGPEPEPGQRVGPDGKPEENAEEVEPLGR